MHFFQTQNVPDAEGYDQLGPQVPEGCGWLLPAADQKPEPAGISG